MSLALCVHRDDNVATLLEDASPGPISLLGESPQSIDRGRRSDFPRPQNRPRAARRLAPPW